MTTPWSPRPDPIADPPSADPPSVAAPVSDPPVSDPSVAERVVAERVDDELAVLDQLESDLAAVEQAIERLELVSSQGPGGADAAARIVAAVSPERFVTAAPTV